MRGIEVVVVVAVLSIGFLGAPAEATPVDVWLFSPTWSFLGPLFLFPYAAPSVPIGTAGIDAATTVCTKLNIGGVGNCFGAGSCDANPSGGPNVGEACLGPVPFFNSFGAATTFVECALIPPAGFLNAAPTFFVAQDVDSNGVINPLLGDVVIGDPFQGPIVTAGVFPFAFPFLVPGIPLHIIPYDPGGILGVWLDIVTVTCGAV